MALAYLSLPQTTFSPHFRQRRVNKFNEKLPRYPEKLKSSFVCNACSKELLPVWPFIRRHYIYSSNICDVDPVQLSELWAKTLEVRRDPERILKSLMHSYLFVIVLLRDEGKKGSQAKIIGIGRVISDGAFLATICDVAVDPLHQNKGIGRKIVKYLAKEYNSYFLSEQIRMRRLLLKFSKDATMQFRTSVGKGTRKMDGPRGFVISPPPLTRRFFWMLGFRYDKSSNYMLYRGSAVNKTNSNLL